MADPKRLEQLATKLDQLVKVSSFMSGFNNINSVDMAKSIKNWPEGDEDDE